MLKYFSLFFILLFSLFFIQNCQWIEYESAQVVVDSEYITLEWDPPDVNKNIDSPVTAYRIYYRVHEMQYWTLIDVIPAEQYPKYKVYHSKLGNGVYDFAIRAVVSNGRISSLHSSLDLNADPLGGWYVVWMRFEDDE